MINYRNMDEIVDALKTKNFINVGSGTLMNKKATIDGIKHDLGICEICITIDDDPMPIRVLFDTNDDELLNHDLAWGIILGTQHIGEWYMGWGYTDYNDAIGRIVGATPWFCDMKERSCWVSSPEIAMQLRMML